MLCPQELKQRRRPAVVVLVLVLLPDGPLRLLPRVSLLLRLALLLPRRRPQVFLRPLVCCIVVAFPVPPSSRWRSPRSSEPRSTSCVVVSPCWFSGTSTARCEWVMEPAAASKQPTQLTATRELPPQPLDCNRRSLSLWFALSFRYKREKQQQSFIAFDPSVWNTDSHLYSKARREKSTYPVAQV